MNNTTNNVHPLLECRDLKKVYPNGRIAVNDMSFQLYPGKIIGLLGPNGSGKSTLIKMVAGLLTPSSGTVSINGIPVGTETKKTVSYLPEHTYLNTWMRVDQILDFFCDFYEDFDRSKALDMLASLSINPNDRLGTMSKGTREKVQLILVMSRNAGLILLDEPIGGVDPAARDYILSTIIGNYNENASIIISTHLISDVENVLDDIMFIREGNIVLAGDADDIRAGNNKSIDDLFREVFRC